MRRQYGEWPARAGRMVATLGALLVLGAALAATACASSSVLTSGDALPLTRVPWCDQPYIQFQDDSKLSHPVLSSWETVKGQLGFTPYLPPSLPKGSCLDFASGTIHDPIFGALFRITYNLPQSGPLAFNEAPRNTGQGGALPGKLQCSGTVAGSTPAATATTSATPVPALTVCQGAKGTTNVTIASAQSSSDLEQVFNGLQAGVEWVPQTASPPTATATTKP